ncbi:MAG: proton-conducting transporter membrane subunit [bacterium]
MNPILLFLLPFGGLFVVGGLGPIQPRLSRGTALWVTLLGAGLSFWTGHQALSQGVIPYEMGGWAAPWGIEIRATPFGCLWIGLIYLLAALTLAAAPRTDKKSGTLTDFYDSAFLLLAGSFAALVLLRDFFDFYLFIGIILLSTGFLAARSGPGAFWTAYRFVFGGSVAASFLLLGLLYLYAETGTLNLNDLSDQLFIIKSARLAGFGGFWVTAGLSFFLVFPSPIFFPGFFSKGPLVGMTFWAPLLGRAAALLLFEFYFSGLAGAGFSSPAWLTALEQTGSILFLAGIVLTGFAKTWTRAAGFWSVASLGYVGAGFVLGTPQSLEGALWELVNQAVTVSGLFYLAAWLTQTVGTDELSRFSGAGRRQPWMAGLFILLGCNMAGLPFFGGFYGKYEIFQAALREQQWFLVLGLAAAYLLGVWGLAFSGWKLFVRPKKNTVLSVSFKRKSNVWAAAIALAALAGLALGFGRHSILKNWVAPALPKAFQAWTPPSKTWDSMSVE